MDLGIVFAPVVKHVEVVHPAGAKFRLYPQSSPEPWQLLSRRMSLKKLEGIETYFAALNKAAIDGVERPKASDYFETGEDIIAVERMILAAHVAGWVDLSLNGEPLAYSFDTACKLIEDFPPFGEWVVVETRRLAADAAEQARLAESISGN